MVDPAFLTIDEVAKYLGVSRWTVSRRIRDGELRAIKIDGLIRVDARSLAEFVERHYVPATNDSPNQRSRS